MSKKTVYVCDHCGGDAEQGVTIEINRIDFDGGIESLHACSHECLGQFVQTTKFPRTRANKNVPQVSEKTKATRANGATSPYRG